MNTVSIGDFVMYKNGSVCRICDISKLSFGGTPEREYYKLETIGENSSVIYVPLDSDIPMRRIMNRDEIMQTLDEAAREIATIDAGAESPLWRESPKERSIEFNAIIDSGDRVRILRMLSLLAHHREKLEKTRKKLYAADERCFNAGVRLIGEEFAFVLGISKDDVTQFITKRLYGE